MEFLVIVSYEDALNNECKEIDNTNNSEQKIVNIFNFYDKFDENLIIFIKGHLFIEYVINLVLSKALNIDCDNKTFSCKVKLLYKNNLIDEDMNLLLISINKIRNKIAHSLNYNMTFKEIFNIVKLSSECGVIYSDDTIYNNYKLSFEWYGVNGILTELFPNLFSYLIELNEKYFDKTKIEEMIS